MKGKPTVPLIRTVLSMLLIALLAPNLKAQKIQSRKKPTLDKTMIHDVMLFGATGTIGDGILKALIADPAVRTIHVVTRRETQRMAKDAASGKVRITKHRNYLDYSPLALMLRDTSTVYWALGTSARNVNDQRYTEIHVDFPVAFVKDWMAANRKPGKSFHLVTGAGTGANSWFHWAREKAKAEKELFALAQRGGLRVIAYRPSFILAAKEHAGWFKNTFLPILGAIRTTHIGQCMLEISRRSNEIPNGRILEHGDIKRFARVYRKRGGLAE